jgi:hypothetical protein
MNVTRQLHRTNIESVLCPITTLREISIVREAITVISVKPIQQMYPISTICHYPLNVGHTCEFIHGEFCNCYWSRLTLCTPRIRSNQISLLELDKYMSVGAPRVGSRIKYNS